MKVITVLTALEIGQEKIVQLQERMSCLITNGKFDEAIKINTQVVRLKQAMYDLEECEIENYRDMYERLADIFNDIDSD